MKQCLFIGLLLFALIFIFGCNNHVKLGDDPLASENVNVVIKGGEKFPEYLVGLWQEDTRGWVIRFQSDGAVSIARHTVARFIVKPGQVTTGNTVTGGETIFTSGKWSVEYDYDNRNLSVEIILDQFITEVNNQKVEGSSKDFFIGTVSKDGKYWSPEWYAYPEFIVTAGEYDHYKVPVNYDDNPRATLKFYKVE